MPRKIFATIKAQIHKMRKLIYIRGERGVCGN